MSLETTILNEEPMTPAEPSTEETPEEGTAPAEDAGTGTEEAPSSGTEGESM